MEQITCGGCRFDRNGKCHDWTLYDPEGGDLLTDDGVRLCYENLSLCSELASK
jgi:hypothetical protein